MSRPSRTAIHAHDPTYIWKLLLRVLAILFAAVAIGTIAWAITVQYNGNGDNDPEDDGDAFFYNGFTMLLPWVIIPLGLSVIWNIVNVVILLARNRWIHPGANVGCDLILWLGLGITGGITTTGAVTYFYGWDYGGYDDTSVDFGYGNGIFPNGTSYYNTANGTQVAYCGDVGCGAQNAFNALLRHVGIVVFVGCAFAFIVMLFHFALFISACRYTHSRRHSYYSANHTRAVTEEATQIARRLIAEMTGPNGGFVPINSQQQQPLLQPDQNTDTEIQRQPESQISGKQPMQQQRYEPEASGRRAVPLPPPPEASVDSRTSEVSNVAERWAVPPPPEVLVGSSASEANTHPALRRQRDASDHV